ncbi:two-partner secretion domain-containing protein [Methylobacillus pratensis]
MNKHRYRLIFNRARGLMMAVAENIPARNSAPATQTGATRPMDNITLAGIPLLRLSLMLILGAAILIPTAAQADIIADPSAPASQQPIIGNTANGLPLINIQTPSAAGVSRNTYSQFDVNAQGAILNNSNTNVQTQLGGWVQGNPLLAGGAARVILNEINSSNPSLLNGFIEIAGSRAQLVIANPAGISCNGCGFINANRATLTTGTPIVNSGNLLGYRVGGGSISFIGNGMDASHADYTDVITRSVEVNAGIWAKQLNITSGVNQVDIDSNGNQTAISQIATASTSPAFAVDVAALGGMYAGKIHLVGTEAGLGVRNAGHIGASVGEVVVTSAGQLVNRGTITAQGNLEVEAAEGIDNTQGILAAKQKASISTASLVNTDGTLTADGSLDIDSTSLSGDGDIFTQENMRIATQGDIYNSGRIIANGHLQLSTDGQITNASQLQSGQTLQLTAQSLDNQEDGEISGANSSLLLTGTLTNRGLIDGSSNFIRADAIDNIGTGRLYGGNLAIHAASLTNHAEAFNGTTTAATIAARDRLELGINTLVNQQGATIFSAGDLAIAGTLDANNHAAGRSGSILNESASIEALGDMDISTENLTNQRTTFSTQRVYVGSSTTRDQICVDIGKCSYIDHMTYQRSEYEDEVVANSPSAFILAAGNANINFNTLNNLYSNIEVGGNLDLTGSALLNQGAELFHQTDLITTRNRIHWGDRDHGTWVTSSSSSTLIETIPAIISAGGTLTGTFTDRIDNTTIREQTAPVTNASGNSPGASGPVNIHNPTTSSLFHPAPDATASYLIETDPQFASYRAWLSSDYMMQQLSFDPAITQKRLGDGFYEQRLVREQIAELTGRRFLDGYANDEAQYQALMSAGLTQADSLQLIPGIALSAEQVAQLTSDIVWLVEQEVTLPDGTVTKALVPQVYVRLQENDISPSGAVLAGSTVNLQVGNGDLNTSGIIAGRDIVNISADNIHNVRGLIAGTDVLLAASHDINIEGGSVVGKNSLIAAAGNNLTVQSSTTELNVRMGDGPTHVQSRVIDRVAGLYVSNPEAILVASAGNDLNLMAAAVRNEGANGQTLLQAGNDLNIGTVATTTDSYAAGRKSWRKEQSSTDIGSSIATSGDISLQAGNNLSVTASSINSDAGDLKATAGGDISITAGTNTFASDAYRKVKTTSRKKEYRDTIDQTTRNGSTLSAENIVLQAGTTGSGNLAVQGSNIVSTSGTKLQASGDVIITSVENTLDETHTKKEKKSGFSASGSSIGYGTSNLSQKQTGTTVTQSGSTVGSVEGNVSIQAGKTYSQIASDVLTPEGDIEISAQQVNITAGNNTSTQTTETKFKQSSLTLAITSPVISAIQTAEQMKQAASNTSDGRMQALAAGTTALAAKNAYDGTMQALNAPPSGSSVTDAANQAGGVNLSLSIGTSKSSSTSTQTSSTAQGSTVMAGGDVNITATGAGEQSDINVIGSSIKADGDVSLKADDEVNLIAAQNTETLNSKNKNSSASVGISIGSNGLAITASASQGKGKASGTDITWTESVVEAGNKVTLESGTDTNIIGAQVRGDQVVADVGTSGDGDLNIQSLQDISTYDSKQSSSGISVSVPVGAGMAGGSFSSSNTKIKSDYASVNEQAGIYAGDGGFQVNVNGNTDLKGAVIASSEQAIQDNKNTLTTETLTVSDIQNKAEYDAKASSATIGDGIQAGLPQLSGAGIGSDSDKADSTTVSAVSGGIVDITNGSAQATMSGTDSATTIALLNRDVVVDEHGNAMDSQGNSTANTIAPIFDAEKVAKEIQAQVQITEAFGQQAHYAVGQYVQEKRRALQQQLKEATTPEEKSIIQSQLKDLRLQEQVMNVLIGAVTGQLDTALGKEALSAAAEKMREITIANSSLFKGITDGNTVLNNTSGESEGVRGDGIKGGGTRVNLDNICGTNNARCETRIDENGNNVLDLKDGMVQWKSTNTISLAEFLASPEGQQAAGATGGIQGWIGTLFDYEYQPGSWQDKLIEAFGGTHDYIGGQLTGLYDEQGNTKRGMESTERFIRDRVSELAILPSTPFAMAELLPPGVWTAISILLKGAK